MDSLFRLLLILSLAQILHTSVSLAQHPICPAIAHAKSGDRGRSNGLAVLARYAGANVLIFPGQVPQLGPWDRLVYRLRGQSSAPVSRDGFPRGVLVKTFFGTDAATGYRGPMALLALPNAFGRVMYYSTPGGPRALSSEDLSRVDQLDFLHSKASYAGDVYVTDQVVGVPGLRRSTSGVGGNLVTGLKFPLKVLSVRFENKSFDRSGGYILGMNPFEGSGIYVPSNGSNPFRFSGLKTAVLPNGELYYVEK